MVLIGPKKISDEIGKRAKRIDVSTAGIWGI